MKKKKIKRWQLSIFVQLVSLLALFGFSRVGHATGSPDFDSVSWVVGCQSDPTGDKTPSSVDLVGDATNPAPYFSYDSTNPSTRGASPREPARGRSWEVC